MNQTPNSSCRLTSDIPRTSTYRKLSLIHNQIDYSPSNNEYRFIHIVDLQIEGILPQELTCEQRTSLKKLDLQVGTLPFDKQQQFLQTQRTIVPKYLANAAQTPTTTIKRTRSEIIGQEIRQEQSLILRPNTKRRFLTRKDAIECLLPYHLFAQPITSKTECEKFDELFEKEAKRLLNSTERIQQSIERIAFTNESQTIDTNVYDQYLIEKIQLDDLREDVETRKRHKPNRLGSPNFRYEPVMSDEAYFDLFQSEG